MEVDSNRNEPSHFISEVCQQSDNAVSIMKMAPDKSKQIQVEIRHCVYNIITAFEVIVKQFSLIIIKRVH